MRYDQEHRIARYKKGFGFFRTTSNCLNLTGQYNRLCFIPRRQQCLLDMGKIPNSLEFCDLSASLTLGPRQARLSIDFVANSRIACLYRIVLH